MPSTEQMMATLLDMGFSNNRAVRALRATGFKVFGERSKDQIEFKTLISGHRAGCGVAL